MPETDIDKPDFELAEFDPLVDERLRVVHFVLALLGLETTATSIQKSKIPSDRQERERWFRHFGFLAEALNSLEEIVGGIPDAKRHRVVSTIGEFLSRFPDLYDDLACDLSGANGPKLAYFLIRHL